MTSRLARFVWLGLLALLVVVTAGLLGYDRVLESGSKLVLALGVALAYFLWLGFDIYYEVRHNVFQPGETVVHHRRAARYVHVIVEGDVDIVRGGDDGEDHVVRAMHSGDHFDQKRLDRFSAERAIARSVVRTVSLRSDQADRLQEVLQSAGRLVAWSGEMPAMDANLRPPT